MLHLPTNISAMTAVAARAPTEQNLNQAENQVPAGWANSSAADNPADWPIATLADVETAIGSIATAASTLGATTSNLPTQRTYVSNLSDSLTTGVGALVGANVNEAATKPAALQGEPLPGAQALSISNSNTKLILKLFEL
jgi:flagellin-like hook-associated protein FlgL